MAKVVSLSSGQDLEAPNAELVEMLERLLERAKSGEFRSACIVATGRELEGYFEKLHPDESVLRIIGMLSVQANHLSLCMNEALADQEE